MPIQRPIPFACRLALMFLGTKYFHFFFPFPSSDQTFLFIHMWLLHFFYQGIQSPFLLLVRGQVRRVRELPPWTENVIRILFFVFFLGSSRSVPDLTIRPRFTWRTKQVDVRLLRGLKAAHAPPPMEKERLGSLFLSSLIEWFPQK